MAKKANLRKGNLTLNPGSDGVRDVSTSISTSITPATVDEALPGLAATAAALLAAKLRDAARAKQLTNDEKRYVDVLFGVLDRAGYAPHKRQDIAGSADIASMTADDLAAMRARIGAILAERAKPVPAARRKRSAQDSAQDSEAIDVIPPDAFT